MYFARFSELSPCKEIENHTSQANDAMADKSKRSDTSSGYGSSTSSAFSRLRYNLSPVSSYYKPLMKTFGKRDDTPPKVSIICVTLATKYWFFLLKSKIDFIYSA